MDAPPVALVPLRDPADAKTRLAPALADEPRASLVGAMLADVVAALRDADVERIVVLAGGPLAAAAARALGVDALPDPPGGGLDAALAGAASRIRGAEASLVVTADLPTLTGDDVRELLAIDGQVVVAPTDDGGTGALLRRPAWCMPTSYGGRSAARHLLAARRAGLSATRVDVEGFRLDVDVRGDLDLAAASARLGPATAHVLQRLGLRSA